MERRRRQLHTIPVLQDKTSVLSAINKKLQQKNQITCCSLGKYGRWLVGFSNLARWLSIAELIQTADCSMKTSYHQEMDKLMHSIFAHGSINQWVITLLAKLYMKFIGISSIATFAMIFFSHFFYQNRFFASNFFLRFW
jgi:hypothetical protein